MTPPTGESGLDGSLTVITVTHNSRRALEQLLAHTGPAAKACLLVVDNASSDATAEYAIQNDLRLIQTGSNLGFGAAANLGARAAQTPWLCFLNPDTCPAAGLFEAGVAALVQDPHCIAAPRLDEAHYGAISGVQPGYTPLKLLVDAIETNYPLGRATGRIFRRLSSYHDHTWRWAHGACLFVSRSQFLQLGGFDEQYFLYMEDVDLGRRASQAGHRFHELDQVLAHTVGQSSAGSDRFRIRCLNCSRRLYARKHHGRLLSTTLALLTAPIDALRWALRR